MFYIVNAVNLEDINYLIPNINNGNGINLVKQTINIDVDDQMNISIYNNSYSYTSGIQQSNCLNLNPNIGSPFLGKSDLLEHDNISSDTNRNIIPLYLDDNRNNCCLELNGLLKCLFTDNSTGANPLKMDTTI